ncbi:hypothetical protein BD779DRAFT_1681773 [Infundibulicybe gibba]|nr:hypothetical protein BD779DRAFT_1681773 [Infundibulicybe gibba]
MVSYEMRSNNDQATVVASGEPDVTFNLEKAPAEVDDRAASSLVQLRFFMLAGASLFIDAYDTFAIGIASLMLGYVYGTNFVYDTIPGTSLKICTNRTLSVNQDLGLNIAAPLGTLVGQLVSWLADKAASGRKKMRGVELIIIIGATFAQALAGSGAEVMVPLMPLPSSLSGVSLNLLGDAICDPPSVDPMWRLLIGLDIERDAQRTSNIHDALTTGEFPRDPSVIIQRPRTPKASWADFREYFCQWNNMKVLIVMSYPWFILGCSSIVLQTVNFNSGIRTESESTLAGLHASLKNICGRSLILAASSILGHWVSPLPPPIIFIVMGCSFDNSLDTPPPRQIRSRFFAVCQLLWDFVSNTATPSLLLAYHWGNYRPDCACETCGQQLPGSKDFNGVLKKLLIIFGFIMLTGIPLTLLLPETRGRTSEELEVRIRRTLPDARK